MYDYMVLKVSLQDFDSLNIDPTHQKGGIKLLENITFNSWIKNFIQKLSFQVWTSLFATQKQPD